MKTAGIEGTYIGETFSGITPEGVGISGNANGNISMNLHVVTVNASGINEESAQGGEVRPEHFVPDESPSGWLEDVTAAKPSHAWDYVASNDELRRNSLYLTGGVLSVMAAPGLIEGGAAYAPEAISFLNDKSLEYYVRTNVAYNNIQTKVIEGTLGYLGKNYGWGYLFNGVAGGLLKTAENGTMMNPAKILERLGGYLWSFPKTTKWIRDK